jgi:ankyrin repeat protein
VKALISCGADMNTARAVHGKTPLHEAASRRCLEIVVELLAAGAMMLVTITTFVASAFDFHHLVIAAHPPYVKLRGLEWRPL